MKITVLSRLLVLGCASLILGNGATAQTNGWPNRPIRMVVPGPAGSGMDIFARLISEPLSAALKQPVIIDNKAGANSIIGNDAVAKAAPDGYTILLTPSSSIAINPILQAKMPYNTKTDLIPVAQVGAAGILLVANPKSGFKSLQDMINYAKSNPGKLSYGTWGNGSTGHLAMEGIKSHYGLDMPHIPYKGTTPAITDLLSNVISVAFTDIASPIPHIKAGKLTAIGATGSGRGPALSEVPTLSEQGYKFDTDGWYGVFVPVGTAPAIIRRLNQEINNVLATESVSQQFKSRNMLTPQKSVEQFTETVSSDINIWQSLAQKANLKID